MGETTKAILSWMGILGIPSIFAMTGYALKQCHTFSKQVKILMAAQKAQMRSQLLNQYYEYKTQGYISSDDLDDWENQYKSYHLLVGENGVLDARRKELLQLPSGITKVVNN